MTSWQQVAQETQEAADRIQFDPGRDFKKTVLYSLIESGAGNEHNCFTPWWFALGDARHLGMYLYFTIFFAANNQDISLEQLKDTVRWIEEPVAFCAYCGLEEFGRLSARVIDTLDAVNTKEELIDLLKPLRLYAAYVNQWSYHYFPYAIGYMLPLQDEAYFAEGLHYARMP